jgi:hypothetical protein
MKRRLLVCLSLSAASLRAETCADYAELLQAPLAFEYNIPTGGEGDATAAASPALATQVADQITVTDVRYLAERLSQEAGLQFLKGVQADDKNAPSYFNLMQAYEEQAEGGAAEFVAFKGQSRLVNAGGGTVKTVDGFVNKFDVESPDKAQVLLLRVGDKDPLDGCDIVWIYPNGNKDTYRIKKVAGKNEFLMYGQYGQLKTHMMKITSGFHAVQDENGVPH